MTVTRNGAVLEAPESKALPDSRSRAATISSWGVKVAVAIALAASAAQLLDLAILDHRVRWLDMNTHASLFGAMSLFALASAGVAAALLAASERTRGRASVLLPGLLAVLLFLRLLHPVNVVFFAFPFAAATFAALWEFHRARSSDAQRVIRTGCVVLAGSYLVHAFGGGLISAFGYGSHTWLSQARLLVSHTGELAGWVLVAAGLAAVYAGVRRKN